MTRRGKPSAKPTRAVGRGACRVYLALESVGGVDEAAVGAEELAQARGGFVVCERRFALVVPHDYRHACRCVIRDGHRDRLHPRSFDYETLFVLQHSQQGHPRQDSLREELALAVHEHPSPVEGEAELVEVRFLEADAGGGLERVDVDVLKKHGWG